MAQRTDRLPEWETSDEALLRDYQGALRSYFRRRVGSAELADDLVQEAFARLFASIRERAVQYPAAYLFRIAANLLADHERRRSASIEEEDRDGEALNVAVLPDQEDARHLADLRWRVQDALDELPANCRAAFVMRRFQDMSTPEIADALGITPRMVQKHLTRALAHLYLRIKAAPRGAE